MPFADLHGLRVHYSLTGKENAPALIFSNSLGTNFSMWDPQAAALEKNFRILRYDTRGHGQTAVPPGPYSIEQLSRDVLALLDHLKLDRVNFCGLSMGGMIGQWLGVNAPQRFHRLVLCNTAAKIGTAEMWNARIATVRKGGTKSVAAAVVERWFTPEFRAASPAQVATALHMLENSPAAGYAECCAAIRDMDQRETVKNVRVPTLVIAGAKDPVTPPAEGRFLAEHIPGAKYAELPAAHLSNIEASAQFTTELLNFLKS